MTIRPYLRSRGRLLLLTLLLMPFASASYSQPVLGPWSSSGDEGRISAWASTSVFTFSEVFSATGRRVKVDADPLLGDWRQSFLHLNLGATYSVYRNDRYTGALGAELVMATDDVFRWETGRLAPQNLAIFAVAAAGRLSATAGTVLDLNYGTNFFDFPNSDRFHAVRLGVAGYHQLGGTSFTAGVQLDRPFSRVQHIWEDPIRVHPGTVIEGQVSIDQRLRAFTLGSAIAFRRQGALTTSSGAGELPVAYSITLIPFGALHIPNTSATLFLRLAASDEYSEYGYALVGRNDVAPRLGYTVGLSVTP